MNRQFRTNFLHSALACPLCGSTHTRARFFLPGSGVVYRCRECTVEFISPQPDEIQLKKLYSESYYAAWGISGQQDNESTRAMKKATFRLRLALIRQYVPPGRILDIGCATGYFLEVAEEEGFKPFGVEFSAYAAARARLRFGAGAIFQGTLEQSFFPNNSFMAITMSDLLEHVRSPSTTVTVAERLLNPTGVILIMTPDIGAPSRFLMGQRWTHYKPEHLFYFNRRSITWLANRCGLQLEHFERSKKALNLSYLHTQFGVYRHWLLTPLVNMAWRLAPKNLRNRNFYLGIGEMAVILKKRA
ncbi:MAG TPA: class I SAM-dependent methyltransferase [Puia sp.]|nr:class I SAM-dependent methyltransferase [Puia sp.]